MTRIVRIFMDLFPSRDDRSSSFVTFVTMAKTNTQARKLKEKVTASLGLTTRVQSGLSEDLEKICVRD